MKMHLSWKAVTGLGCVWQRPLKTLPQVAGGDATSRPVFQIVGLTLGEGRCYDIRADTGKSFFP